MKCLEKDRTRRYETVNGLARDVQRYLKDELVEARPPSMLYRLQKFNRRNRVAVFVTAFVVASLAAVMFNYLIGLRQVRKERDRALAAERQAETALASEQAARKEAVAAKEKVEWASRRVNTALQLANEGIELLYRDNPNRSAALEKFNAAADVEPDLETIYVYRRMLYRDIGLWDLAAADYAQSFRLSAR